MSTLSTWLERPEVRTDPVLRELLPIVLEPTGRSSAGYPYLSEAAWVRLRDWVPHVLGAGCRLWDATDRLAALVGEPVAPGLTVVRRIVNTAAITAPPDLWLLRQVLSALAREGWLDQLRRGVESVPVELEPDLTLLLARGYLVRSGSGWRWGEGPTAVAVAEMAPLPPSRPADLSLRWAAAWSGDPEPVPTLLAVDTPVMPFEARAPTWIATPSDLELGYRLVPMVLGLRAAGGLVALLETGRIDAASLGALPTALHDLVRRWFEQVGWTRGDGSFTPVGRRGLERGAGPFGIVEAYHPYLAALPQIWARGRGGVHVARAANVAASQDANRETFRKANDVLDRFCEDTGFRYRLFVEHAVGRGEATRQRWARSGDALRYVGVDLEQAALDETRAEIDRGLLPAALTLVRADIGRPDVLLAALQEKGLDPEGAVMVVGNGLHEVRGVDDEGMAAVLRGYERAGFVLLFTEESALSVDDLLRTAWNTYHAGFRYVHERSGQALRPASPAPVPGLGPALRASWVECALRAGYVRAERYTTRSRTIYPYPPSDGHNPSVSANHFFVPERIAANLAL